MTPGAGRAGAGLLAGAILATAGLLQPGPTAAQPATPSAAPAAANPPTGDARPRLRAAPGVTALSGQVRTVAGDPLPHVRLQIGHRQTRTDATGQFLLARVGAGHQVLLIDGEPASTRAATYGVFETAVDLRPGETTALDYTIWMTPLDTAHPIRLPSPTPGPLVLTSPAIPGLEIHLPAGAVIQDHQGRAVREVTLTPLSVERPPFPLPPDVEVPVYFTLQPGAGYVTSPTGEGARIYYPNRFGYRPGTGHLFWHYDPDERGWYVYGAGAVSRDGAQVVPEPGISVYETTGAMVGSGQALPPCACPVPGGHRGGDPVDLATGLFVLEKTDLVVPDVLPLVLRRTSRPGDLALRQFGMGATHNYALFVRTNGGYLAGDLVLPGGGRIHLVRISPGTDLAGAVFEHTETPTEWYKARVAWDPSGGGQWVLTRPDGLTYRFEPTWGNLSQVRDRFGNALTLVNTGRFAAPAQILTTNGRWVAFTYETASDGSQRITQLRDNLGRTVSYTYDAKQRLATVTDPAGGVTTYTYFEDEISPKTRMRTLQDARGIVFLTNAYDNPTGRITTQTLADGTTYQFAYTTDGSGAVVQTDVTDPRGLVRRLTFDTQGYVLTDTRALGRPEQQTTTYERQAGSHLVTAVVDPLGRRTETTYDAQGYRTSVTRLAGTANAVTTTYTYEPTWHQLATVTDPLNHRTTFGYDPRGALTSITDPLTHQTTLTPNAAGQPTAVTDPLSHTTQLGYDGGDLVTVTDPLGQITRRYLDGAGRVTQVTDPLGRTTRYAYDPLNRLTGVVDPLGGATTFAYDPNGNLLSVTDARSQATTYTYDVMDRLATRTDPLTHAESYQYDANGNLTQVTDRKSQVTTYTYDGLDRRTQASYQDGATVPPRVSWTPG